MDDCGRAFNGQIFHLLHFQELYTEESSPNKKGDKIVGVWY